MATRLPILLAASVGLSSAFITRRGNELYDEADSVYRYGGANNFFVTRSDKYIVDDFFARASKYNFSVVRTWPFNDYVNCTPDAFQCWDAVSQQVQRNDTALQMVDYVVAAAGRAGVRLIMTLVNNWDDYGGMDVYTSWRVQQAASLGQPFTPYHDSFYTDPVERGWYQQWVAYLTGRVNSYTGIAYKDDPTILAWELGNEIQCNGSGQYNVSSGCIVQGPDSSSSPYLTAWVQDMSAYIKSVDPNHLVAVGSSGFYCNGTAQCQRDWPGGGPEHAQWWCDCQTGDDFLAFAAAPDVDIATAHLYPAEVWQWYSDWWAQVIANHTYQARILLKKAIAIEEFGWSSNVTNATAPQHEHYAAWTAYAREQGVNGWNFWQLVGRIDNPVYGACDASYPTWYTCSDGLKIWCNDTAAGDPPLPPGWDYESCGVMAREAGLMRESSSGTAQPSP